MQGETASSNSNWQKFETICQSPVGLVACPWLILIAAFANFLHYNSYPLFDFSAFAFVLAMLLPIGVMAFLYNKASRLSRFCLVILFAVFAVELMYASAFAVYFALAGAILLRERTVPVLTIIALVTLASLPITGNAGAFGRKSGDVQPAGDGPAIVHIVLDEHIGIEGLSSLRAPTETPRDTLKDFYRARQFTVFGGAYSSHFHTINSLSSAFNLEEMPPFKNVGHNPAKLDSNAYFDAFQASGLPIEVIQSNWVDYCQHEAVSSCTTYPKSGPFPLAGTDIPVGDKTALLASGFISLSNTLTNLTRLYDMAAFELGQKGVSLPYIRLDTLSRTSTLAGFQALTDLEERLENARPGQVWFAHVLFPHYPYSFDRECKVLPTSEWKNRRSFFSSIRAKEEAYLEQLQCTMKKIDSLYNTLLASPAGDNFVMVLHGDHGARLNRTEPIAELDGKFTDADLVNGFSTLFAIRHARPQAGYLDQKLPLYRLLQLVDQPDLLWELLETSTDCSDVSVMLDDMDWTPVKRRALPCDWKFGNRNNGR